MPPNSYSNSKFVLTISSLLALRRDNPTDDYMNLLCPSECSLPVCVSHAHISTFKVYLQLGIFGFFHDHTHDYDTHVHTAHLASPRGIHSHSADSFKQGYAESARREYEKPDCNSHVLYSPWCFPVGIQGSGVPILGIQDASVPSTVPLRGTSLETEKISLEVSIPPPSLINSSGFYDFSTPKAYCNQCCSFSCTHSRSVIITEGGPNSSSLLTRLYRAFIWSRRV